MIGYDFSRFIQKICVVDAEVGVEPPDLIGDELVGYKALEISESIDNSDQKGRKMTLAATAFSTRARCSSLPLKTGVL